MSLIMYVIGNQTLQLESSFLATSIRAVAAPRVAIPVRWSDVWCAAFGTSGRVMGASVHPRADVRGAADLLL